MHCRSIALAVSFLALAPAASQAAPCLGQRTALFVINGIWVSQKDAQKAVNALKERLRDELGCDLAVIPAYNQTVNRAEDLYAASQKLGNPIDPALARLMANGAIDLAMQNYPRFALDAATFFTGEIVRNIQALNGDPTSVDEEDIQTHYGQYVTALNAGARILLVGHSEGNLFANIEYDGLLGANPQAVNLMTVVGIATPAYRVAGDPSNSRYTTLHSDIIATVIDLRGRHALRWNAESPDCNDETSAVGSLLCHQFDTYLHRVESWESIRDNIKAFLSPQFNVNVDATLDGQPWSGLVEYSVATPTETFHGWSVPGLLPNQPTGGYTVAYGGGGPPSAVFSGVAPGGTQTLTFGGKLAFTLRFQTSVPPPPNQPPTAGFSMSVPGQIAVNGGTLNVSADPATGEARVTFTDSSTDPDGVADIESRRWTTDTPCTSVEPPPCVLSEGLTSFTWGFTPGRYTVTLTIRDSANHEVAATGTIDVAPAAPLNLNLLPNTGTAPEGAVDPYWTLLSGATCPPGNCVVLSEPNATNNAVSKWIRPTGGTPSIDPSGQYVYRLTFLVNNVVSAPILGRWATDDRGLDIRLNGVSTGQRSTNTFEFAPFAISGGLVLGVNTLDFVVENKVCSTCPLNPVALRVEFGTPGATLLFDGSVDPRFRLSSFDEPQVDQLGNLIVVKKDPYGSTCGGTFCQPFTIVSLSPTGTVNWEATEGVVTGIPYVGSDSLANRGIAIGANGDVFVAASRNQLAGYRDGRPIPGWPVRIDFDGATVQAPSVSSNTGDIYAWTSPTFVNTPPTSVVLSSQGVERLRLTGMLAGMWLIGPGGDPFISSGSGAIERYDSQSLAVLCQGRSPYNYFGTPITYRWGSPDGLLGSFYSLLFKADGACSASNVTTLLGSQFSLSTVGAGRAFGFEYDGSLVTPTNPKLVGVRISDGQIWRQQDIAPGAGHFKVHGGSLYLFAQDRSDAFRPKLFVVDGDTGSILRRLDTSALCGTCGLAVAPNGTVYVGDLSSTRIFRIQ